MARKLPILETSGAIRNDGSRRVIHPADVSGRFHTARKALFYLLVIVMLALPWIRIRGNPAMLLDIPARRFFFFGTSFNAQDTYLLFFLLIAMAWSLVMVTTLAGRAWCGWTCPQTVFLEGLFRPIERLILGNANKRIAQDQAELSVTTVAKKAVVHALWVASSALVAHAVVSFFVAPRTLASLIAHGPAAAPVTFLWSVALTAGIYFNFAWFREQTCLIVCPYGRLQSALVDKDSLIVGYDTARGEPRGKAVAREKSSESGDCVDCKRCVVVCPTGIDIRNGPQLDCIGCTACIDACDEVMDKLERPRGLVRYDSLNGLEGAPRKIFRTRVAVYLTVGAVIAVLGILVIRKRTDFVANVLRVQGAPYTLEGTVVRNAFNLHLVNKRSDRSTFVVEPISDTHVRFVIPLTRIALAPFEDAHAPVFVESQRGQPRGDFTARLRVRREGAPPSETLELTLPCLAPLR
ncbi:MAG: cytochrome c oxidase accessory protein CcoG [Deltaproteobacteria bacterium]|nr:cytochrome c oxidase accessory protein CcoG [Deltaproteobacteria bacterium]